MSQRLRCAAKALWPMLLAGSLASAAEPAASEATARELAPLQCWWRTDRNAIYVGQHLKLTLTCAVAETPEATAMPDWDPLQPEAVDLAPFEVVNGTRSEDVVADFRRYTQFEYTLRLTGEEFFGQDVPLPSLTINYSIAVTTAGGMVQQGRERTYVLPPLPLKVLSLVPAQADDIEEVAGHSFAALERARSRAAMAFVIGCGLLAAGALYAVLFLHGVLSSNRARQAATPFRVADWRLVIACQTALRQLAAAADREGWTETRLGEALALLRVLAAIAIGRPVRQQIVERTRVAEAGEWLLHRLSFRRPRVAVSAAVTPAQLRAQALRATVSSEAVEDLAAALAVCSDAYYGRESLDAGELAAISQTIRDVLNSSRELLLTTLLPARLRVLMPGLAASGAS
jgi:hypothetical protein